MYQRKKCLREWDWAHLFAEMNNGISEVWPQISPNYRMCGLNEINNTNDNRGVSNIVQMNPNWIGVLDHCSIVERWAFGCAHITFCLSFHSIISIAFSINWMANKLKFEHSVSLHTCVKWTANWRSGVCVCVCERDLNG